MAAWFVLVVSLGISGAFVGRPGQPPVAIAIGVGAPLLMFFAWLRFSPSFRAFILSLDLRLITAMQAWRWAGLGFLSLYAHNVLPAMFALPAGLGDMAVGFAAPWMILALVRRSDFAGSRAFVRWNLFGMLDLAVAIVLGTLSATLSSGAAGEITTAPMATLPLLVIPAFLVPLFLMLHTAALMQSRLIARGPRV
ncbi:hypothetical protein [Rhodanobacter sp. 7MK24]|uniref:hypothetical protein n=1 Tax=Rhodanobacter sp. 7MK24 TaxID=2775922 RepID=UPI001CE05327|nr:hypothetical protein [Rhodanobacter sp. 7MK24]